MIPVEKKKTRCHLSGSATRYRALLCCDVAPPAVEVLEFHDTLEGMWATELAIHYMKYALGYRCAAYDLIQGLQN